MKTIGVVSILDDASTFLKQQLDNLFGNIIKVNRYSLCDVVDKITITEEELLVFAGNNSFREKDRKMIFSCPAIIANRSLNYRRLDDVFKIRDGAEVYMMNDFKDSAYDSIKQFNALGINQFHYIPFYPGAKDDGVRRVLITVGEYGHLPSNVDKIIDIGIRTIDISTIVEIMLRIGLPNDKIHQITAKYVQDIILLTKEINHLNQNNEYMKQKLETVVQTVDEGIITFDSDDHVLFFNSAAEKIFSLDGESLRGKKRSALPGKMFEMVSSVGGDAEEGNALYDYCGKQLDVSLSKVSFDDNTTEKICIVREVTEIQKLERNLRVKLARQRYVSRYTFADILGTSKEIQTLKKMAGKIAVFDQPVYIYGESGTGKELFAQAIHARSKRAGGPFVAVNFAALSESLLESELFGYVEGAFTGARKGGMPGVFEQAHGGTLFLDEIGDSPLNFQIKLLRVLQEKQVRRVGDDKLIPVDVRIIVATNKDIAQLVQEKKFREDLYYRLNVLPLNLLPLRERKSDIIPLAKKFYEEAVENLAYMPEFETFFSGKLEALTSYDFPGNARQLRNAVEYLICISEDGVCPDISLALGGHPAAARDEDLVLETIRKRASEGLSSGRRSLSEALALSEDRIKRALLQLNAEGLITINKGRKGITLSERE